MTKKNIKKKGGSIASDKVNSLVSKVPCNSNDLKVDTQNSNTPNKFAFNNYGSVYKIQGGKRKSKKNQKNTLRKKKGKMNSLKKKQKGSSRDAMENGNSNMVTGSKIPPTYYQNFKNFMNGSSPMFTDSRSNTVNPSGLQLACSNTNCSSQLENVPYVNDENMVLGFESQHIPDSEGLTFHSSKMSSIQPSNTPPVRAGGKYKKKMSKKKGGNSDFANVLQSRGPYNNPNSTWHYPGQDGKQVALNNFRAFNKTSVYVPPRSLSNGAFTEEPPANLVKDSTFNDPWITSSKIIGFNGNGLSTHSFKGGRSIRRKLNSHYM